MSAEHITAAILDQDGNPLVSAAAGSLAGGWKFDTGTADADPGNRRFRFNNAAQPAATQIFINKTGNSGVDAGTILLALASGDKIYIQESSDSSRFHLVNVTGAPVDAGTYVKIPITVTNSGTDLRNNRDCLLILFFSRAAGGGSTHKHISGFWHGPVQANDIRTMASNEANGIPIEIPETGLYDALGLVGGFTGNVKLYVYDSDNGGLPKTRLQDLGSVAVGFPTIKAVTPFQLTAGFKWLFALFDAGNSEMQTVSRLNQVESTWESLVGRTDLTQPFQTGVAATGASFAAGLPADLTTLTTVSELTDTVMINIRKA